MTQTNLSVLTLLSSLILVGITAWYAWQTHKTVVEMRESRRSAVEPHIRLDFELLGSCGVAKIENLGPGPALDVRARVTHGDSGDGPEASASWDSPVLRVGESRLLRYPLERGEHIPLSTLKERGTIFVLAGTCKSVTGEVHAVKDSLEFSSATREEIRVSSSADISARLKVIGEQLGSIRDTLESMD